MARTPGGILGRSANEGEGPERGVVQVGGDVRRAQFAHALRLGLRQVLRRARSHMGTRAKRHARDPVRAMRPPRSKDDGRLSREGHHDDAERLSSTMQKPPQ